MTERVDNIRACGKLRSRRSSQGWKKHETDGIWTQDLPICSLKRLTPMLWGPVSLPTLVVLPLWLFPFIKNELYCFMVVYCLWLKANCTDHCDVNFWQWHFWFQVITVCCFFRKQWTCSVKHGMPRVRHSVDDLLTPLQSALTPVELSTWNDPLS